MPLRPYLAKNLNSYLRILRLSAAGLVALMFALSSHATTANQFFQLNVHSTGGTPVKIVTADFNHDGKADIVALNSNNVLSILLGTGSSSFAVSKTIATLPANTASLAARLVAGDFNGDGHQDVALMASPGNLVKVFLGHGDGTFAAPVTIADGLPSAGDMLTGDFNGDDKADLVVANGTSISVLLGKSGGTFQTPIVTKTGLSSPTSLVLAVGDVNRDSHLDIAANDTNGETQVLLGTGTGHFTLKSAFSFNPPPENLPTTIAIADFTGDGKPDIAVGFPTDYPIWYIGQACIIPGYGDGTFNQNTVTCARTPYTFGEMHVGNLNGKQDLVFSSDPMMVQFNNGSGVMTSSSYGVGGGPMVVGDFSGDGRQDIAVGAVGGVQVVVNSAPGVLRAPLAMYDVAGGTFTESMIMNTTDFNGDGYADLAVIDFFDEHGSYLSSGDVLLGGSKNLLTRGGNFGFGISPDYSYSAATPAIGDFNHDGKLDIAIATFNFTQGGNSGSGLQVSFGDGKGNFPTSGPLLDTNSNYIAAGDYNGDGKADLASLDGSTFEILIGKGDGTFASPVTYAVGLNPVFVLQADLNGDGKKDIIVVNQGGNDVSVLLGKGDGTFLPQKTYAAGTAPVAVVTGDFNRDGKIDMAVASSAGISVLLGNGNGTFQAEKTYSAGGAVTGIAESALHQDGLVDLIGIVPASQRFVVLPGTGSGTFGSAVVFPLDRAPTQMVAGDFNHDGATDLAFLGNASDRADTTGNGFNNVGSLVIFYNQGGDHLTLTSNLSKPTATQSVTFTAHVIPSIGEIGTPSGVVTFKNGSATLGTVSMSGGAASITTKLTAGTHQIVASYGGNSSFNPNHSVTLTIVVTP
ncbi:FG-GAP-like repeat-containing protein [Telmatobacter sp. DSM 110680]|uniref:FG-GAP-like repeat-containing protein n=1 Tax=Telmatobacter sp. DSM 110680 TaxID=3036704 RepID=A0AAU7DPL0_9BACT